MGIVVTNVTKHFGDYLALDDVSLEVPAGSLTALLGPSGSGKSTLLRLIAGLETPDSGTVSIDDREVTGAPPQQRGVGFVFQHYAAFTHMSVRDNIGFGLKVRKRPKDFLVPPYLFDRGSNYLVMGGLIFQELSMSFLQSFGSDWENNAPLRLIFAAKHSEEYEKQGRRKLVILAGSLPTRSTQGYERIGGVIVTQVNGKPINDITDLDKAFKDPQDGLHKIELEDAPKVLYLDAITAESDNLRLLSGAYRIGSLKRIE